MIHSRLLLTLLALCLLSTELLAWRKYQKVEGVITDALSGEVVEGVKVHFHSLTDEKDYNDTSRVDGRYKMPDKFLTDSQEDRYYKYKVTLTKAFHNKVTYDVTVPYKKDKKVLFDFKIERIFVESAISGVVRDEGGPVPGVKVTANNPITEQTLSATSDAKGAYSIQGI